MVRLDSVKVKLKNGVMKYNKDYFLRKTIDFYDDMAKERKLKSEVFVLKDDIRKKIIGLKSIEIDQNNDVLIEFSGKILRGKYFEGICKDTISDVIERFLVDLDGICILDVMGLIFEGDVLRCDVCDNLRVSRPIKDYIYALNMYFKPKNFSSETYGGAGGEAIVFKKSVKTYKCRMIFYDKYQELCKDKKNYEFFPVEDFRGVLRCEQNITSFERLRKAFQIDNQKLINVLESGQKVNYNLFNEIKSTELSYNSLLSDYEGRDMEFWEILQIEGIKNIIRICNFDFKKIKLFIKRFSKSKKNWYWYRKFRKVMDVMVNEKEETKQKMELVNEIENLLLAS